MPPPVSRLGVVRFGIFEADFRVGELRKAGVRIKIHDQPLQALAMLLDRQGELVNRGEIRKRLWLGDTFVDFDHGLNNAVARLREALGDSYIPQRDNVSRRLLRNPRSYTTLQSEEPVLNAGRHRSPGTEHWL